MARRAAPVHTRARQRSSANRAGTATNAVSAVGSKQIGWDARPIVLDDAAVDLAAYELMDLAPGRRLERFGERTVVRPHPAPGGPSRDRAAWGTANLVFDPDAGWAGDVSPWPIALGRLTVELRPTAAGQLGLFPEQAATWAWLEGRVAPGARVLNLFAYTGVATLTAALAGAAVVHVDAARPTVAWARHNAELSGLADRPIRWIVDDAAAFTAREVRRGSRYDGIVLDPPSYGHGPGGRAWRIERDLPALLERCSELVREPHGFAQVSAHTPGLGPEELAALVSRAFDQPLGSIERGLLRLTARTGGVLELGAFARWPGRR